MKFLMIKKMDTLSRMDFTLYGFYIIPNISIKAKIKP